MLASADGVADTVLRNGLGSVPIALVTAALIHIFPEVDHGKAVNRSGGVRGWFR